MSDRGNVTTNRRADRRADKGTGNGPVLPTERENPMTTTTHRYVDPIVRSTQMILMYEALARAQYQERLAEAEHERVALRVAAARRHQRRAERAARRASRANRLASVAAARAL